MHNERLDPFSSIYHGHLWKLQILLFGFMSQQIDFTNENSQRAIALLHVRH